MGFSVLMRNGNSVCGSSYGSGSEGMCQAPRADGNWAMNQLESSVFLAPQNFWWIRRVSGFGQTSNVR